MRGLIHLGDKSTLDHLLKISLSRRSFARASLGGLLGLAGASSLTASLDLDVLGDATPVHAAVAGPIPPLFCVAYIDPNVPGQGGQEALVARYPLALVPQDMNASFWQWRDRVKGRNPNIVMLGYQMTIEETTVPGPGHAVLKQISDAWCVYPNGFVPTVGSRGLRIFDPRKPEWQQNFLKACQTTLESYPYDGLFLDQCTVFGIANPLESVRAEMRQALQDALLALRNAFPTKVFIGNSSFQWRGLNGEMNESRLADLGSASSFTGHVDPVMPLYVSRLRHAFDVGVMKKEMAKARAHGALYGASVDYQHVLWFDEFDEVLAEFKRAASRPTP